MATDSTRKFAAITGASSGIGFSLAKQCIAHGYDVLVCAEDDGLPDAAAKLTELGGVVRPLTADLATREGCETLCRAIEESRRPLELLFLNAGVGVGGRFLDTPIDDEIRMIELNCLHTVRVAKQLLPMMVKRRQGRVGITGSVVSTSPAPFEAVYGATKAFVMSLGEALREELRDTGVTVTVIQPGATDTQFFARAGMLDTKTGRATKDDPDVVAKRAFDAVIAGKASVLAGELRSRLEGLANEILPETAKARSAAKAAKPLTGDKR